MFNSWSAGASHHTTPYLGNNIVDLPDLPGNSFGRFEKAVKRMLAIPKEEIDKREAEYQRTKKTARKRY